MPSEAASLGVLLISAGHERAHYAFVMAAGAAAIGRATVLFATNEGCRALLADAATMAGYERDAMVVGQGVAGFDTLRAAATEMGVRLIACEAGLRMAGLTDAALAPGVEVAGVTSFLEATRHGQLISL